MIRNFLNQYINRLPKPLRNKFIVVSLFFVLWMAFFDKHSLYKQYKLQATLSELKTKHVYYKEEITKDTKKGLELTTDDKSLEKFAREEHLMKRWDEDIFVIVEKKK
jgi:cell division protein DivIC